MLRHTSVAVAWLIAALVVALGAAGIVAALDHLPDGAGRPELTWTADQALADDLDAVSVELLVLADAAGVLGGHGRTALSAMVGRDSAALVAALDAGAAQLDTVDAAAARVAARLATIPLAGPDRAIRYSSVTLARYDAAAAALASVDPLRPAWVQLAAGVAPAAQLIDHLLAHDKVAGQAIQHGGAGEYRTAIRTVDAASAELDAARAIRDRLAAAVDVSTLDDWIARNAAYDKALRDLWDALRRSGGRVTDAVRTAAAAERTAKEELPADARALVVIVGDVARGGLNQAVITIEEARGELLDALARAAAPAPAP